MKETKEKYWLLAYGNPELAQEWDYKKNEGITSKRKGQLTPYNVACNSNFRVYWQCSNGHSWVASISMRNLGSNCPYCVHLKIPINNCIQVINSELAKEWHPTKNAHLTPYNVLPGSTKKIWWLCNNCNHEWISEPRVRSNGSGCPKCRGRIRRPNKDNCLANKSPETAKFWHPTKNKGLTPHDIRHGTIKKVWWHCEICKNEWEESVAYIKQRKEHKCKCCKKNK